MQMNSGQAEVRRLGTQLATGDYIIHCDSDDWVNADMYKKMWEKAVGEDLDIVVCDFIEVMGIIIRFSKGYMMGYIKIKLFTSLNY